MESKAGFSSWCHRGKSTGLYGFPTENASLIVILVVFWFFRAEIRVNPRDLLWNPNSSPLKNGCDWKTIPASLKKICKCSGAKCGPLPEPLKGNKVVAFFPIPFLGDTGYVRFREGKMPSQGVSPWSFQAWDFGIFCYEAWRELTAASSRRVHSMETKTLLVEKTEKCHEIEQQSGPKEGSKCSTVSL